MNSPRVAALALLALGLSLPLAAETPVAEQPLAQLPYTPSLDPAAMDRSVDPCVDFYAYSCGGWIAKNPIPADRARWSVYGKLQDENTRFLWGLLEQAARPEPGRSPSQQKTGDYFAACMDEAALDQAGLAPLRPELEAVAALQDKAHLPALLARLHGGGVSALFGFGSAPDLHEAGRVAAFAVSGGLGLPDRDYYVQGDPRSLEARERYAAFLGELLRLAGDGPEAAAAAVQNVMRIETVLARGTLTRVERRDPRKLDNRLTRAELLALTPSFAWGDYLSARGLPELSGLYVTEPAFYKALEGLLAAEPLAAWRDYLRAHLLRSSAPYLSRPFADAAFGFHGRFLRGVEQQAARHKRCVDWVDRDLGEVLGQVFVEKAFGPEVKGAAVDLVERIEKAMERRLQALAWMGPKTREQALAKLHGMRNKIGYPDRWRDYSALEVRRGEFLGNVRRAAGFEERRQLAKVGQAVDRGEWDMTPPTVNAYYDPSKNDMNFPAGVLLPPLFDLRLDEAPNYGNTGGTVGHELVHGFDDEGRRFDEQGNLRDWWTAEDGAEFERRAKCVADQYAQYVVVDDIKLNSQLTLGEDVADLAGLLLAWDAWQDLTRAKKLEPRDGLSPEQRFFVGFAQWDCGSERPESLRLNARTNPHSPSRYRINGVVVNLPEFARAFACRPGQPMVKKPEDACRIW